MMTYLDGTEVRVGDRLSLSPNGEAGVVSDVLDSTEKAAAWGLAETGLMIDSTATGLTFYAARSLIDDDLRFVSRVGT